MRPDLWPALLLALAATASCRGTLTFDESVLPAATTRTVRLVTQSLQLPASTTDFAVDVDGNGSKENQFGAVGAILLSVLSGADRVTENVRHGDTNLLITIEARDLRNGPATIHLGWATRAADGPVPKFDGKDVFLKVASQRDVVLRGTIKDGHLSTPLPSLLDAGSAVTLPFKLQIYQYAGALPVSGLHLEGTLSPEGDLLNGEIHGAVRRADFDGILPSLAHAITDAINREPDRLSNIALALESGEAGMRKCMASPRDCCKVDRTVCRILPQEIGGSAYYSTPVRSDVQVFAGDAWKPVPGGAAPDAVSFGISFSALGSGEFRSDCRASDFCREQALPPDLTQGQQLSGIYASAPDDVWAVGAAGRILHYDGWQWRQVPPPAALADAAFLSVHGSGRDDIWMVGKGAVAAHYDGRDLTAVAVTGGERDLRDVFALPGGAVYAAATDALLRLSDGKLQVEREFPGADRSSVWASSPTDVWFAGRGSAHFDGVSWTEHDAPQYLISLWSTAGGPVYATATEFHIYRFTTATGWGLVDHGNFGSASLQNISGASERDLIFAGPGGTLRYTGAFSNLRPGDPAWSIRRVFRAGPRDAWFIGDTRVENPPLLHLHLTPAP